MTAGQYRALSRRKYVWKGDFVGQAGKFELCPAKSMCRRLILWKKQAISGFVSQIVRTEGRFCGIARQFRALSHKTHVLDGDSVGRQGNIELCSAESTCGRAILRDNQVNSGIVSQKVRVGGRFCGTARQIRALSRRKYVPEADFVEEAGNFRLCLTNSTHRRPVLRDSEAISGVVPQNSRAGWRFCGTTCSFSPQPRFNNPRFAQIIVYGVLLVN